MFSYGTLDGMLEMMQSCTGHFCLASLSCVFSLGMAMWMREYEVNANYAHIRKYVDGDENLLHIMTDNRPMPDLKVMKWC